MTRATSRLTVSLANHEPVRDLGVGMAGAHELETGLAPLDSPHPPRQASGAHRLASFGRAAGESIIRGSSVFINLKSRLS